MKRRDFLMRVCAVVIGVCAPAACWARGRGGGYNNGRYGGRNNRGRYGNYNRVVRVTTSPNIKRIGESGSGLGTNDLAARSAAAKAASGLNYSGSTP